VERTVERQGWSSCGLPVTNVAPDTRSEPAVGDARLVAIDLLGHRSVLVSTRKYASKVGAAPKVHNRPHKFRVGGAGVLEANTASFVLEMWVRLVHGWHAIVAGTDCRDSCHN
jgi:hypothetical protein